MMKRSSFGGARLALATTLLTLGCAAAPAGRPSEPTTSAPTPSAAAQRSAGEAVAALRASRFDEAQALAQRALAAGERHPHLHLVRALTTYKEAGHQVRADVFTLMASGSMQAINHRYMRFALEQTEAALKGVEEDLAQAARSPDVTLELCLACWKADWNGNGREDERDQRLFEIEQDAQGEPLPADDPRRRPTFRFDVGDVYWARALVSFQRAFVNVLLAYRYTELSRSREEWRRIERGDVPLVLRLEDPARVHAARELLLAALGHADRCRREYLQETDDDREWVPNPRQKSHPLPLPVDAALYETWEGVIGDLQRLLSSKEGVDVAQVAQLGDHQWERPPGGYIDIGRLFSQPGDITLQLSHMKDLRDRPQVLLRDLFGAAYVAQMPPTRLLTRLLRMKGEVQRGHESLERKLRYLLWLN